MIASVTNLSLLPDVPIADPPVGMVFSASAGKWMRASRFKKWREDRYVYLSPRFQKLMRDQRISMWMDS